MADIVEGKPKKKGKLVKLLGIAVVLIVLVGVGAGAGMFFAQKMGGAKAEAAPADNLPRLVPKSEEVRVSAAEGSGSETSGAGAKEATPPGEGGAKYASTYYELDKDFTSNLQDSVHYIQIGVAVSTPYDQRVIDNLKTHEIAVRSAILMALGDTTEDEVFTSDGKKQLQKRLVGAINRVLIQKEGFGGISNVYFTSFVVQ
ncbi:MAG TPA: flagellar basal body-associated FliL family protein [Sphingomonas sp.]|nr:flagellar basal body-associated FliL family protein [Sphingomonas sp.]